MCIFENLLWRRINREENYGRMFLQAPTSHTLLAPLKATRWLIPARRRPLKGVTGYRSETLPGAGALCAQRSGPPLLGLLFIISSLYGMVCCSGEWVWFDAIMVLCWWSVSCSEENKWELRAQRISFKLSKIRGNCVFYSRIFQRLERLRRTAEHRTAKNE